MSCARYRQVLDAHTDGELDRATGAEIDAHLAGCNACTSLLAERRALGARIRGAAAYYSAPPSLRARLSRRAPPRQPTWLQAAALAALSAILGLLAGYGISTMPQGDVHEAAVTRHVASLASHASLTDVASSERHTVKPWFQGKVDFAPPVRDLSDEGFALVGGRLDELDGRRAAAIVYRVRKHYVQLFVSRASDDAAQALSVSVLRGFSVATWQQGGMRFAAVSDVDRRELERFARGAMR